jgi:hypothetical protein
VRDEPFLVGETALARFVGGRWAAVEREGSGLAVLASGARGYAYDRQAGVLQRVLAWSPESWMYASDDSVTPGGSRTTILRGQRTWRYALLPYQRRAKVVAGSAAYRLPPAVVVGRPAPGDLPARGSLLRIDPETVELSGLFVRDGAVYGRLWNASATALTAAVYTDPDVQPVAVSLGLEGAEPLSGSNVPLRPWGVQTVRW